MDRKKKIGVDIFIIFLGCLMVGISFTAFFDRFGMAPGGLSGLFVIIKSVFHIQLWVSNLVFNIPMYILAFKILTKEECLKTLCGILFCSVAFKMTAFFSSMTTVSNPWAACIIGGLLLGAGTGIIFRVHGSTGGTGLLATLLNRYADKISIPKLMGVADGTIVLLSALSSGKVITAVYSAVALGIVVAFSDYIIAIPAKKPKTAAREDGGEGKEALCEAREKERAATFDALNKGKADSHDTRERKKSDSRGMQEEKDAAFAAWKKKKAETCKAREEE